MKKTNLSQSSLTLLQLWQKEDKKFFRKHKKDRRAMEIVSALAELIATYEILTKEQNLFYC